MFLLAPRQGTSRVSGKQNSVFLLGPVIKCLLSNNIEKYIKIRNRPRCEGNARDYWRAYLTATPFYNWKWLARIRIVNITANWAFYSGCIIRSCVMYAVRVIYLSFFKAYLNPSRPFSLRDKKKKILLIFYNRKKVEIKNRKSFSSMNKMDAFLLLSKTFPEKVTGHNCVLYIFQGVKTSFTLHLYPSSFSCSFYYLPGWATLIKNLYNSVPKNRRKIIFGSCTMFSN